MVEVVTRVLLSTALPAAAAGSQGSGDDGAAYCASLCPATMPESASPVFVKQEPGSDTLGNDEALVPSGGTLSEKPCTRCKEVKPLSSFFKDPQKKFGCTSWCKGCFSEYTQSRKAQHMQQGLTVCERQCSICKQTKPADEFIRDARRTSGLDARCKLCRRQQHRLRKATHSARPVQPLAQKQCRRCLVTKPASEFKRHSYTSSGLDSWCKACCSERRREKGKTRVLAPTVEQKQCVRCRQVKPATEFTRDTGKRTGLGARCRPCENIYRKEKRALKRVLPEEDVALLGQTLDLAPVITEAAAQTSPQSARDCTDHSTVSFSPAKAAWVISTEGPTLPEVTLPGTSASTSGHVFSATQPSAQQAASVDGEEPQPLPNGEPAITWGCASLMQLKQESAEPSTQPGGPSSELDSEDLDLSMSMGDKVYHLKDEDEVELMDVILDELDDSFGFDHASDGADIKGLADFFSSDSYLLHPLFSEPGP